MTEFFVLLECLSLGLLALVLVPNWLKPTPKHTLQLAFLLMPIALLIYLFI
tara:strand:- start:59 stop:211 length:153 start_codon:yes stop_codon:yes gene_type:complete